MAREMNGGGSAVPVAAATPYRPLMHAKPHHSKPGSDWRHHVYFGDFCQQRRAPLQGLCNGSASCADYWPSAPLGNIDISLSQALPYTSRDVPLGSPSSYDATFAQAKRPRYGFATNDALRTRAESVNYQFRHSFGRWQSAWDDATIFHANEAANVAEHV